MAKDRKVVKSAADDRPGITNVCVTLDLPLAELAGTEYVPTGRVHLDISLSASEAHTMKRLQRGLNERAERLADGRFVQHRGDVIRFLLDQINNQTSSTSTSKNSSKKA